MTHPHTLFRLLQTSVANAAFLAAASTQSAAPSYSEANMNCATPAFTLPAIPVSC